MDFKEPSPLTDSLISSYKRLRSFSLKKKRLIGGALLILLFCIFFLRAPFAFPEEEIITIERGETLSEISTLLEQRDIIDSSLLFEAVVILLRGDSGVVSGDYYLGEREGVLRIAYRLTRGIYDLTPKKITLPEGSTVSEMATILKEVFPRFNEAQFKLLTAHEEGYLFPDTYFFLPNAEASEIYQDLRENFDIRVESIKEELDVFPHSLKDIVVMASLLEEEARTTETRRMIAGILWKRLEIGIPLQVDAVFPYIIGKNTFEVTLEDLGVDSPYNTYKYKGLPPGPITNPGLDSLLSAVTPISSPYLFYLSDRDGIVYYAKDFEEHKRNKALYLR